MAGPGGPQGRVAVVTGVSSGIGRAIVRHLRAADVDVVGCARRGDRLREVEQESSTGRGRMRGVAGDAADPGVIEELFTQATNAFGADPDLVVANAGRGLHGSLLTSDPAAWAAVFEVNVLAALRLMRVAGERLRKLDAEARPRRDIVVLGSIVGRHVSAFSSVYSASKAAVASATEALRREIGPDGVRVTLVEPGFVASEFQQRAGYTEEWFAEVRARVGPLPEPEDVARAVLFIVQQPGHLHLSDIVIRPVRQDYP